MPSSDQTPLGRKTGSPKYHRKHLPASDSSQFWLLDYSSPILDGTARRQNWLQASLRRCVQLFRNRQRFFPDKTSSISAAFTLISWSNAEYGLMSCLGKGIQVPTAMWLWLSLISIIFFCITVVCIQSVQRNVYVLDIFRQLWKLLSFWLNCSQ